MANIKIKRMLLVDCSETTKAYVDITYHDLTVRNCKVVKGSRGFFVSLPQDPGEKDARYYNIVNAESPDLKAEIKNVVLSAYKEELSKLNKL